MFRNGAASGLLLCLGLLVPAEWAAAQGGAVLTDASETTWHTWSPGMFIRSQHPICTILVPPGILLRRRWHWFGVPSYQLRGVPCIQRQLRNVQFCEHAPPPFG